MKESTYIRANNGAVIWLARGKDKFRQEVEERMKLAKSLLKDVKDEEIDEVD